MVEPAEWMIVVILLMGSAACGERSAVPDEVLEDRRSVVSILTINAPLEEFARRIGGEHVSVGLLPPAGIDPADWAPAAKDVLAMQAVDLVILNGAGYEPWVDRVALPERLMLDTSRGLTDELIRTETLTHRHGPEGAHSHAATAYTLWLDPLLAIRQAASIRARLSVLNPTHGTDLDSGFNHLEADLLALHDLWSSVSDDLANEPLLFSHPVYQYLERRYGLDGRSLHWEPDEDPGEAQWAELEDLLDSQPARVMVWESEPLEATRQRLQSLGLEVVVVAPSAEPGTGFIAGQRAAVAALRQALLPFSS